MRAISHIKKNRVGRAQTSFLIRAALACLITALTLLGAISAAQADVKIVVAGSATANTLYGVARYNPDGSLDTSFDTDGKVTTDVSTSGDFAFAVAIQADGKIVAAGYSWNGTSYDFCVVRYNADGSLDTDFGSGGWVLTDFEGGTDEAHAVAIQSDGKIVVAGWADVDPTETIDYDFAVVRYNTDGSLDTDFGTGGKMTTYFVSEDVS
ncbi:MAG: hypothetical protein GTO14_07780, partial [Anaerolineales bacterium]|nr:hypothetical protein [Anaerolineales bacterium]